MSPSKHNGNYIKNLFLPLKWAKYAFRKPQQPIESTLGLSREGIFLLISVLICYHYNSFFFFFCTEPKNNTRTEIYCYPYNGWLVNNNNDDDDGKH